MKPEKVNILGKEYKIVYVDNPADDDINKRKALWSQVNYGTRQIRIYDGGRHLEDVFHTLLLEIIHVISDDLKLGIDRNHLEIYLLALSLTDILFKNEWLALKKENNG